MLNLTEYRAKNTSLADFLPWAALVAPGVVLNKDGSFQRTAKFRGPDLDSATPAELIGTTARLNNALRRLGSGWAIFVEAQRTQANHYPDSRFPDPVSALVDAERKAQFEEEGAHFESGYFMTVLFLPPAEISVPATAKMPRAPRAGSMRAAKRAASTHTRSSAASSTAPTAYCNSSKVSSPRSNGSMTPRR